jgi:hypothetical protein
MTVHCEDLQVIFARILDRVNRASGSFFVAATLLARRMEVESRIAAMLEEVIPRDFDPKDPVLTGLVEELRTEAEQHRIFCNELRQNVVAPNSAFINTVREKQKVIGGLIGKSQQEIVKAIKEIEVAAKAVALEEAKLDQTPPSKMGAQRQRIEKAQAEHRKKIQNERLTSQRIQERSVPQIHIEFSEFDEARLVKQTNSIVYFVESKQRMNEAINSGIANFRGKIDTYDPRDRSHRYVARVVDFSNKTLSETEPDLIAFAVADYVSDGPKDLQFERGDQIRVLVQHASGWWEGQLEDKRGLFPRSFIMFPREDDGKNEPVGAVFLVVNDYQAKRGGEIGMLVGDMVYVEFCQIDKCSGFNMRTGARGFFPLEVLERKIV